MRPATLALAAALSAAGPIGADEARLDEAVRHALRYWSVPGVAVAVVRDGRVLYLKGHGVREVGKDDPVTPETLFPLSSCTKGFTSAALAALVDAKRVDWDDPVRKHLPWFRLADPLADADVRLRDLLCHRTGVAQDDLLWYRSPWPPEEAARRAGRLALARPFRTTLQYQSTLYAAAGLAGAAADRASWPDLIRDRLLTPLGLKRTYLSYSDALRTGGLASPHRAGAAGPEAFAGYRPTRADPAISAYSGAADMAAWLNFHLAPGRDAAGKQVVSAEALTETHTPQVVMRLTGVQRTLFPSSTQHSYALGWVVHDHHGVKLVSHGGAIDGVRAHLTFAPDKKLGVAVLANLDQTPMALALANTIIDDLLKLPKRDWHALNRAGRSRLQAQEVGKARARLARRRPDEPPTRPLADLAGAYGHPAYGPVRVALRGGALSLRWNDAEAALEHSHGDTFTFAHELLGEGDATFTKAGLTLAGNLKGAFTRGERRLD